MTIYFTAQEALEDNIQLNRASAERIVKQHNLSVTEFHESCGFHDSYWASEIFIFLGY